MQDYKRGGHTIWDCKYHLVWVTKYRYPILDIVEKYRPELARRGVAIHVRSPLHQGLIIVDLDKLPAELQRKRDAIGVMQGRLASAGLPPLDLALSYLGRIADIHAVVAGVTRRSELEAIVTASRSAWPNVDASEFAVDDPRILDPTAW